LDRKDWKPDIINLHNLHGEYFDLRALSSLSSQVPIFWTLHDTWSITGHCAHFIDCDRWVSGCGDCPDLARTISVKHDKTHENWQLKKAIYSKSYFNVICPSKWLLSQVEKSMMQPVRGYVIPNGIDLSIFRPGDKKAARHDLGLPQDKFICLFLTTSGASASSFKDYFTVRKAIDRLFAGNKKNELYFICLGGGQNSATPLNDAIKFVGRVNDPKLVAKYYQSADVFLHAANADTFPTTILESFACGTPVVATSVGGITEQVADGEIGWLVPRGDSLAMAKRVEGLITDRNLCSKMGENAARLAARSYSLERQIDDYLKAYNEAITEYIHPRISL
jgi:glycosyltransferase involved in cell wall biosynthesis